MRLTNWYVDRPKTVLTIGFGLLIVISAISFYAGYFDLIPQHNREYLVWDHPSVIAWDK